MNQDSTELTFTLNNQTTTTFHSHDNVQSLSHPSATVWISSADFIISPNNTIKPISLTAQANKFYQKIAVRKLFEQLVNAAELYQYSPKLTLNETAYPYRIEPMGFYVSFSHSSNKVACAISSHKPIGIDIESKSVPRRVAQRYYHQDEIQWIDSLEKKHQQIAVNLLWMLKESMLKKNSESSLARTLGTDLTDTAQQIFVLWLNTQKATLTYKKRLNSDSAIIVNNHTQSYVFLSQQNLAFVV